MWDLRIEGAAEQIVARENPGAVFNPRKASDGRMREPRANIGLWSLSGHDRGRTVLSAYPPLPYKGFSFGPGEGAEADSKPPEKTVTDI